jgi:hypothetical protein
MDTDKPQTSDEEGAQPPLLPARSPYRPLSLRRRQAMPAVPQPAVGRPVTRSVFNASPNTIAAALGIVPSGDEATLTWRADTTSAVLGSPALDHGPGAATAPDGGSGSAGPPPSESLR